MRQFRMWTWLIAAALVLLGGLTALPLTRGPILVHVFGEGDCACGDYHEKTTGVVIWNCFRDRQPEKSADAFLGDLRAGKCSADPSLCDYAVNRHRVSDWILVNRNDTGNLVTLYFKLTKYGTSDPRYKLPGEGMIEMQKDGAGWIVSNYSAYF